MILKYFKKWVYTQCEVITSCVPLGLTSVWLAASHWDSKWPKSFWLYEKIMFRLKWWLGFRSPELQWCGGKWHYCSCSMGSLMKKSKTLWAPAPSEQLYCNEWPAILNSGGLGHCVWAGLFAYWSNCSWSTFWVFRRLRGALARTWKTDMDHIDYNHCLFASFFLFFFFLHTYTHACTRIMWFGLSQPSGSYSAKGSWGASAVACGVRCGMREVGQLGRQWRCRGWTAGRRWWVWLRGCCGGVLAGKGCGGSGHIVPAGRGRPGGEERRDWLSYWFCRNPLGVFTVYILHISDGKHTDSKWPTWQQ